MAQKRKRFPINKIRHFVVNRSGEISIYTGKILSVSKDEVTIYCSKEKIPYEIPSITVGEHPFSGFLSRDYYLLVNDVPIFTLLKSEIQYVYYSESKAEKKAKSIFESYIQIKDLSHHIEKSRYLVVYRNGKVSIYLGTILSVSEDEVTILCSEEWVPYDLSCHYPISVFSVDHWNQQITFSVSDIKGVFHCASMAQKETTSIYEDELVLDDLYNHSW